MIDGDAETANDGAGAETRLIQDLPLTPAGILEEFEERLIELIDASRQGL